MHSAICVVCFLQIAQFFVKSVLEIDQLSFSEGNKLIIGRKTNEAGEVSEAICVKLIIN
jgi:hypothetical protein